MAAIVFAIFGPWYPASAKMRSMKGKRRRVLQQIARPVAVLNVGGQHAHAEQEAERVDKDMTLAARDLLARIEALRVERSAPF